MDTKTPKATGNAKRFVGFFVDPDDHEWLQAVARAEDRSVSAIVRRIVRAARENEVRSA